MTAKDVVTRVRRLVGTGRYRLGAGGMDPMASTPFNLRGESDCSGMACWALGVSRKTDHPLYVRFNGGWINTDAMVNDLHSNSGFFEETPGPVLGGIVVYGGRKGRIGHVGIISALEPGVLVIHCSAGNYRSTGAAVQETDESVFLKRHAEYGEYVGITR